MFVVFVHEQSNDYQLLYTILDSAHHVYYIAQNRRKQFLYALLDDHGIWHGDAHNWRECILEVVEIKVQEAARRKQRKEQSQPPPVPVDTSGKNFFKRVSTTQRHALGQGAGCSVGGARGAAVRANINLVFTELSKFVQFFINFSLRYETANTYSWSCASTLGSIRAAHTYCSRSCNPTRRTLRICLRA